jgi:carboxymethylenebutenolidase
MCHDPAAEPAVFSAPRFTFASSARVLTGASGVRFATHVAVPSECTAAAVLVLPDNRGLSPFYARLADQLAAQGHPAVAIDYFGRTAGLEPRDFSSMESVMPHLLALTRAGLDEDMYAGLAVAREYASTVVALGFCMGGRFAFLASAARFGLSGAIGLYGALDSINGAPGVIEQASTLSAPILGLFGGADPGIPASSIARFDEALTDAGVTHEFVVYPGAPHSFFDLHQAEYAGASADAWARILAFLADKESAEGLDSRIS